MSFTDELLAAIQQAKSNRAAIEREVAEIKARILNGTGSETCVSLEKISAATKTALVKEGWFIPADGSVLVFQRPAPPVEKKQQDPEPVPFSYLSAAAAVPEAAPAEKKREFSEVDGENSRAAAKKRLAAYESQREKCVSVEEKAKLTETIEKLEKLIPLLYCHSLPVFAFFGLRSTVVAAFSASSAASFSAVFFSNSASVSGGRLPMIRSVLAYSSRDMAPASSISWSCGGLRCENDEKRMVNR